VPLEIDEPVFRYAAETWDFELERSRVAVGDDEPVGICMLGVRGDDGWIGGLGVAAKARRGGIGELLMRAVLDEARTLGLARVTLEVLVQNEPAIRLYEKLGFERVRELAVWSLAGATGAVRDAPVEDAHARIKALRGNAREPWQRADGTLAHLLGLEPAPQGILAEGGAAVVRVSNGRVSVVQLAAEDAEAVRELLDTARGLGDSVHILNLPADDPAAPVLAELGGAVDARQYELALGLA
jgi:ribosomal protein S18 acetylase RimI-like enzyme